ncbi:14821_t:CDS:2 [Cetraspora pellucida]|uniref:14821_t:CDS:1 n=1 Tax=Cetraspora pellucida TaxID=1433469 RepID=A0A9N9AP10_9GLOM|nr:14821_t:CDS:2 [Cetraspora pellucida]
MDLVHEDQDFMIDGDSSREAFFYNSTEGEDDYEETDESYISSLNSDTTVNDPVLASFINELFQDSSDHSDNIISCQKFYHFNPCYYEVLHHGSHIQPALQNIALIVESWLTEKLSYAAETIPTLDDSPQISPIPILEESPQISAESVMTKLKMFLEAFNGLSKVHINIRAGHVYFLYMTDGEIIISPNHKQFIQESEDRNGTLAPNRISLNHQLTDTTTIKRTASSADGQIFFMLDEFPTTVNYMGNNNARFYSGTSYAGEIIVQP